MKILTLWVLTLSLFTNSAYAGKGTELVTTTKGEISLTVAKDKARELGVQFRKHIVLIDKLLSGQDWELNADKLSPRTAQELEEVQSILQALVVVARQHHKAELDSEFETERMSGVKKFVSSSAAFGASVAAAHLIPGLSGIMGFIQIFSAVGGIYAAGSILNPSSGNELTTEKRSRFSQWLLDRRVRKTEKLVLAEFAKGVGELKLSSAATESLKSFTDFQNLITELESAHDCNLVLALPAPKNLK